MIISIDVEKHLIGRVQHPFMIKTLIKVGVEGSYVNKYKPYMSNVEPTLYPMDKN